MSITGIQGMPVEVTVVACYNLEDKEWISRQDPYVSVEYGSAKYRTKTCTDGGKNPTFQEKFIFTLIEGLWELNIVVWNSHTLTADEHIGTGRVPLHKALSQGYDDSSWPLQSKNGRHSGEVRVIIHYAYANQGNTKLAPSAPKTTAQPYGSYPQVPPAPYPTATAPYAPPNPTTYPPSPYPPAGYPQPQFSPLPPAVYPPQPYPPVSQPSPYYYPPGGPSGTYAAPPAGVWPPPPY